MAGHPLATPKAWSHIGPKAVAELVAPFEGWCHCGGLSVDWLVAGEQVFLADPLGQLRHWDGGLVPDHVNDKRILIEDGQHWMM